MDSRDVTRLIRTQFAMARGGSAAAAVTAMLIHRHSGPARELGMACEYDRLVFQLRQSKDADVIVCLGEELLRGKKLARDFERAATFFGKEASPPAAHRLLARPEAKPSRSRGAEFSPPAGSTGAVLRNGYEALDHTQGF